MLVCVIFSASFSLCHRLRKPISFQSLSSDFIVSSIVLSKFCIHSTRYIKGRRHRSLLKHYQQPPIKPSRQPICVSKSSSAMRFAAAPTTVMPSTHALPMDAVVTTSAPKKSSWVTPVRAIRSPAHNPHPISHPFRTRVTGADVPPRTTRATPAGDERKPTGWSFWKAQNNIAPQMETGKEERWQYASRISASVFGAPCGLP